MVTRLDYSLLFGLAFFFLLNFISVSDFLRVLQEEANLHILFEIPHGTGVLFGDTRGWLLSFILFVGSFAVEMIEFYMILFDLHDGWAGGAL